MTVVLKGMAPSREAYEALNAKMGTVENPPTGLIVHTATEVGGGIEIIDVWESQAHVDAFDNDRLIPAMKELMGPDLPPGGPTVTEPFSVILPK